MSKVEKIIPGGFGLATLPDGKKAFFWNALPGEIVENYTTVKTKSHFIEAIATEITTPSPYRVEPKDNCFLSTSPWQNMTYDYELELKQSLIVEIFREHQIHIDTPKIFTDNRDYYYRNKMEYALYWDNEASKIQLAFHGRGSHSKIPITGSSIERPEIFATATKIVDELNSRHEEARKYQSLLLRCDQKGKVSGGLYENHQPHPHFANLTDTILGREYSYSPNGFFQINLPVYEMALTEIAKHITINDVLDLYSGVGTIGLSVAKAQNLTLVECDKFAFNEMAKNITGNFTNEVSTIKTSSYEYIRKDNILAILAKSESVLDHIHNHQTIILDPPRAGLDRQLVNHLLEVMPPTIIYLSCNPATQARDISLLLDKYHIKTIKTYNFFPRTPHIENLVVLTLRSAQ